MKCPVPWNEIPKNSVDLLAHNFAEKRFDDTGNGIHALQFRHFFQTGAAGAVIEYIQKFSNRAQALTQTVSG